MQLTITLIIVIITSLLSISAFSNQKMVDDLIFYPPAVSRRNQYYRFITCGLIHADWAHLIFNMLALYLFGKEVEEAFVENNGQKAKANTFPDCRLLNFSFTCDDIFRFAK